MNTTKNIRAGQPSLLSVLSHKNNSAVITSKAVIPTKAVYSVEDATVNGEMINIEYLLNEDWKTTSIQASDLLRFVLAEGLNEYCFDSCVAGEHMQDAGSVNPAAYIAENLFDTVRLYLQAKKIGQRAIN